MSDSIAKRREKRRRRKPIWPYILCVVLLVLLVAGIMVASYLTTTELKVTMAGDSEITLEFGESYQEAGATAFFGDRPVDVTISGQVQQDKVGTYTISYTAEYMKKYAYVERIVHIVIPRHLLSCWYMTKTPLHFPDMNMWKRALSLKIIMTAISPVR